MKKLWRFLSIIILATGIWAYGYSGTYSQKMSAALQSSIVQTPSQTQIAWIFFRDKGKNRPSAALRRLRDELPPHARQRRLKNRKGRSLVDHFDLPVNPAYLSQVAPLVRRIRHKSRWLNAVSVEANAVQLQRIAILPFVKRLDVVHSFAPPRPVTVKELPGKINSYHAETLDYGASFGQIHQIRVDELHNLGLDGTGVIIAMLDAGFNNLGHEAFSLLKILKTWDFVNGDSIVSDQPGQLGNGNHGTYTLGVIGGFAPGNLIGPAYNAGFLLARTEDTSSEKNIEEDNWVAGAEWADSLGADIISSSLGYLNFDPGQRSYTWQDMDGNTAVTTIAADIAASRGILVVNSAGNEGPALPGQNTLISPADGDSVLAVGGVDANGLRVGFSSMGPSADGRIKPDVAALASGDIAPSPVKTTNYVSVSGTSFSCPLTAGAAALVMQANPAWSNMQVYAALKATASQAQAPDDSLGWGIIDAFSAATTVTAIDQPNEETKIREFRLFPAFPNPFNPVTHIRFSLPPGRHRVSLTVYNNLGQKVTTLLNGVETGGAKLVTWHAASAPSGVYFIRLLSDREQKTTKVILLK